MTAYNDIERSKLVPFREFFEGNNYYVDQFSYEKWSLEEAVDSDFEVVSWFQSRYGADILRVCGNGIKLYIEASNLMVLVKTTLSDGVFSHAFTIKDLDELKQKLVDLELPYMVEKLKR